MPVYDLLRDAIYRVCARDHSVTLLKFTKTCYDSFMDFEHDRDDDDSDDDDDVNSIARDNLELLRGHVLGEDSWYETLAQMIARLPSLKHLAFEELDPEKEELMRFWVEIRGSRSIRTIECIKMDMTHAEEFLIWFAEGNVKTVVFRQCIIGVLIGDCLSDGIQEARSCHITFDECDFSVLDGHESLTEFAEGLGRIDGLKSVVFRQCQFSNEKTGKLIELIFVEEVPRGFKVLFLT